MTKYYKTKAFLAEKAKWDKIINEDFESRGERQLEHYNANGEASRYYRVYQAPLGADTPGRALHYMSAERVARGRLSKRIPFWLKSAYAMYAAGSLHSEVHRGIGKSRRVVARVLGRFRDEVQAYLRSESGEE